MYFELKWHIHGQEWREYDRESSAFNLLGLQIKKYRFIQK